MTFASVGARALPWLASGTGRGLLLVPDAGHTAGAWVTRGYVARFARDRRVVVLGSPETPEAQPCGPSDLVAILDAEGLQRCDVWSYGSGGEAAYALAARRPDRVRSLTIGGFGTPDDERDATLGGVEAPTLVYVGGRDPRAAAAVADATHLRAPLVVLQGLDHVGAFLAVDDVAPVVAAHLATV